MMEQLDRLRRSTDRGQELMLCLFLKMYQHVKKFLARNTKSMSKYYAPI